VSNDENDSGSAVRYFLFRSMLIGFAFYLPACFFPQTRKVLRFLASLEPVQIATDLFQFAILLTLIGLILQGVFYFVRNCWRSFKPHFDAKVTKESID
jgi:hypothetical protein